MNTKQMAMSVAVLTTMVALVFIGGAPGTVYGDDDPVVSTREDPTADGGHEFLYVYASGKEVVVVMSADGILVSIGKIDSSGRVVSVEKYFYDEQGQLKETDTYDGYFPNGNVINKIVKIFDNRGCEKSEEQSFYNEEGVRGETATLYFSQGTGNDCGTADLNTIVLYDDQGHVVSSTTWDWPRVVLRHSETSDRNLQAAGVTPQGRPKLPGVPNKPGGGVGGTNIGGTQAVSPGSASATGGAARVVGPGVNPFVDQNNPSIIWQKSASGGTAGVAGGPSGQAGVRNKRKVTNTGSSFSGVNSATGGTAGVAGSGAGTATGGTAGVVGPSATPSSGQNKANQIKSGPSSIIWQNSASGGTAGVAGSTTATGSGGPGSTRRKSQSKKTLNTPSQGGASTTANIQGSGQPAGNVHPTPTPTSRKKKPGTEVQNEH